MEPLRFQAVIEANDPTSVFVVLPGEIVASLGPRKRVPVRVTINNFTYPTTVAVYGGRSLLGLRKEVRDATGVSAGQRVTVTVEPDLERRVVEVPPEVKRVLARDRAAKAAFEKAAKAAFEKLSYTNQKEYVGWVTGAKQEETRRRRLEQMPSMLRQGRKSP
jgi:hypothetical protein